MHELAIADSVVRIADHHVPERVVGGDVAIEEVEDLLGGPKALALAPAEDPRQGATALILLLIVGLAFLVKDDDVQRRQLVARDVAVVPGEVKGLVVEDDALDALELADGHADLPGMQKPRDLLTERMQRAAKAERAQERLPRNQRACSYGVPTVTENSPEPVDWSTSQL